MIYRVLRENEMCDKGLIKDHKLNRKEFERFADAFPTEMTDDPILNLGRFLFNIIDKDHSETVDKKELRDFLKHCDYSRSESAEEFSYMDIDGDGEISFDEFYIWFLQFCKNMVDMFAEQE